MNLGQLASTLVLAEEGRISPESLEFPTRTAHAFPERTRRGAPRPGGRGTPAGLGSTRAFARMAPVVGNETRTFPLLSSLLWHVLLSSRWGNEARLGSLQGRRIERLLMVFHDVENTERFDLLALVAGVAPLGAVPVPRTLRQAGHTPSSLDAAVREWLAEGWDDPELKRAPDDAGADEKRRVLDALGSIPAGALLEELLEAQPFHFLTAPAPRTIATRGAASPAWKVVGTETAVSTAGVIAHDREGRFGVTACLHGMVDDSDSVYGLVMAHGASYFVGKTVRVEGREGVIRSLDLATDSCFIELEPGPLPALVGERGVLSGKCPAMREKVFFDGASSRRQQTLITGQDLPIPFVKRGQQARVYTQPATNPGDSGAALVNDDGLVVGFCHRRTGLGEPIEYSEWIWGDSVFQALNLQ